jgi:hypothetical protein
MSSGETPDQMAALLNIKGVRQTLLLDYAPGKNSDTSHYDNRVT